MDAYLEIAEKVLRVERRPLSARQIIETAYIRGLVPSQLHGKTQHKTLGARLSEDILLNKDRSCFFRTVPGRFFLRAFLFDETLPESFRTPMIARRRKRELLQGRVLTISSSNIGDSGNYFSENDFLHLLEENKCHYLARPTERNKNDYLVWSFVLVTRGIQVLTYRHGRYREDRDSFFARRSIGFFTPVVDIDRNLFDHGDCGVSAAGLKAIIMDLDLPTNSGQEEDYERRTKLECALIASSAVQENDILAIVRFECPSWFEPLRRHLAINDLNWMDLETPVNNTEDFDPWSQRVLEIIRRAPHSQKERHI